jgi:carboxymethylenebutenolidase
MDLLKQDVTYVCPDGFPMRAYLCRPQPGAALPGIVLVYEAFGLNHEMKRLADEVAAAGYAVMIPDLLSRGNWLGCIRRLMKDMSRETGRGIDDLLAARAWLGQQTFVNEQRMGIIGFCLGAGFAMVLAKAGLFQVAAPFYGPTPRSMEGSCPVVASFGSRDRVMTRSAPRLRSELERLGVPHDVKIYPDAGHGFMNQAPNAVIGLLGRISPMHAGFSGGAARDAMGRLHRFLAGHL